MTPCELIDDFLARKRLAVVGVSRNAKDFSRVLFRALQQRGYDVVAVNPQMGAVENAPCVANVREIHPPVDAALLLTAPAVTADVVRDCAAAGINRVWLHRGAGRGAVSPAAVEFCRSNGMQVVSGECPFMFLPNTEWPHRLHGMVRRIRGVYPR